MTDKPDRYRLEDGITSIEAQLATVRGRMLQAALNGGMSQEVKLQCKALLVHCNRMIDNLPNRQGH